MKIIKYIPKGLRYILLDYDKFKLFRDHNIYQPKCILTVVSYHPTTSYTLSWVSDPYHENPSYSRQNGPALIRVSDMGNTWYERIATYWYDGKKPKKFSDWVQSNYFINEDDKIMYKLSAAKNQLSKQILDDMGWFDNYIEMNNIVKKLPTIAKDLPTYDNVTNIL